jgi:4-hydroxybenzoate polyprenyltransferase
MYVFIHLLYINLLWVYSTTFKRKFFVGNLVIAMLTGFIPIFSSLYFLNVYHFGYMEVSWFEVIGNAVVDYIHFNPSEAELGQLILNFGLGMGLFAFLSNLAREIVKDMEDVKGDLLLGAKTVPIVWGNKKSSYLVGCILLITIIVFLAFILSPEWLPRVDKWKIFAPITVALFIQLFAVLFLFSKFLNKLKMVNAMLKISMLFGLLTPIYIVFLHKF